jgi:hypothetical protein
MLPGFRFLFAAIMLSMSLLVFGVGAAALLRAAHEEVASNPTWRAAPETMLAQPTEATKPVLAMLHVDMPAPETVQEDAPATAAPAEQEAITSAPSDAEQIAALKPEDSSSTLTAMDEAAKPEIPLAENPAASEPAPAPAEMPATVEETKLAPVTTDEVSLRDNEPATPPAEPVVAKVKPDAGIATKIATLGGPPVTVIEPPSAKVKDEKAKKKAEESAAEKRRQAKHAAHRRRLAEENARLAAQAVIQPPLPFGQPAPAIRTR